jgi:hypothetical protein
VKLNRFDSLPFDFSTTDVTDLHEILGGPTLIHLKGSDSNRPPLFLSTLLHGNETSSYSVLQRFFNKYKKFPRDLIIFIGNTLAAREGLRHLPGQVDYNRIWNGGKEAEHILAEEVCAYAREFKPLASIDIHNNTGKNPHYACINSLSHEFKNLASHFGEYTVYFTEPHNVQSMAFSKLCPSVTIEAGLPGEEAGIVEALAFVEKIYFGGEIEASSKRKTKEIYHTIARFMVSKDAKINFEDKPGTGADLSLVSNIDSRNFEIIKKDTRIGYAESLEHILVEDNRGQIITEQFLRLEEKQILLNRTFIPSMFTKDIYVMKEDCLGYLMEVMLPLHTP